MKNKLQALFQKILALFNEISRPRSKYIVDKHEIDLAHNRNKTVILISFSAMSQFIFNLIIGNGEPITNIHGIIGCAFSQAALHVTTNLGLHPQIFKTIFNLYALSFGFLMINNGTTGIFGACLTAPIFPILVYFLTGSFWHFVFNLGCGMVCLNTFCQGILKRNLGYLTLTETTNSLTYFLNQNMAYSLIYTALIHYTIQTTLYKVKVAEKKKDDFEKEKNFLLGFSHELRNLINSLMGNVKLASLEVLSEKVKDLLVNAEVCAELLLHQVNNILDTGKVEINDLEINTTPTRIYNSIERIWSVCSELIKRKNLKGRIKIQKDIPQILTLDNYRLTQIILNLIGNAVKYTDSGHIDVSVEWISGKEAIDHTCFEPYPFNDANDQDEGIFEKRQALSVFDKSFAFLNFTRKKVDRNVLEPIPSSEKGVLKISVSDTGCGILKEDLGILFQRFTQGTVDPSKKKLGTGLGLFITKELCERMDGEVKVFSKRGAGSTFIICLPIEPVSQERAFNFDLEGIQRTISTRNRLRAMVVDDERFSHFILRDFLRRMHVDVVDIAENGLVAYKKFVEFERRRDCINIVTMDLNMPVMDGKTSAQKIREYETEHSLDPCLMIIVSANCSESEINECLDKNGRIKADAFVKKPVSIDELCRIISYHFAESGSQERRRLPND